MSRPKGSKNKRTLAREANLARATALSETKYGAKVDAVDFMEVALGHFHTVALNELKKGAKADPKLIREAYLAGCEVAKVLAPLKYPRLTTTKLIGDPRRPLAVDSAASREDLRAQILKSVEALGLVPPATAGVPQGVVPRQGNGKVLQ